MRLLAALCLFLAACTGEWVRAYRGHLPDPNWEERVGSVVIDARTGELLAGVKVRLHREVIDPGKPVAPFVAEFETDEYGIFSVPWSQRYFSCHWVYEYPGYAPQDFYAEIPEVVELKPGRGVRGRLLDALGRPAAGVEVEHFAGCVHSPTVRRATTDAEGRYTLRNVEPGQDFLWALVPGTTAHYILATMAPVPGYEYEPIRPDPGVTVTGKVVDAGGKPVAEALVYGTRLERGPKTRTAADGTFVLMGVAPDEEIKCAAPGAIVEMRRSKPPRALAPSGTATKKRIRIWPPGDEGDYEFWIDSDEWFEAEQYDYVEVETGRSGPVLLSFTHKDYGDGRIVVNLDRPLVEVKPDAFPVPGVAAVVGPYGRPVDERPIGLEVGDSGWPVGPAPIEVYGRFGWEEVPRTSWQLQPGTLVRVGRDGRLPMRRAPEGRGPYALRWGRGVLDLRVEPADFFCLIDGEVFMCDGHLNVGGLDPGPHTVIVTAKGHVGRVMRIVIKEGEVRLLALALKPE